VALYERLGQENFRAQLLKHDPDFKATDKQRLIRAYEVVTHTGKTLGYWQSQTSSNESFLSAFQIKRILLMPPRNILHEQCDARFLKMIERGAIKEVKTALAQNLDPTLPSMKILGFRELAAHLKGELSWPEAMAKAQQATRNYAKRQVTWFKNQWPQKLEIVEADHN
jgi:tRNA dimethylallyltransferase